MGNRLHDCGAWLGKSETCTVDQAFRKGRLELFVGQGLKCTGEVSFPLGKPQLGS